MRPSRMKETLIFYVALCQLVSSSPTSFSKYRILPNSETNDVLRLFLNQFKTDYLERHAPRHLTFVGSSVENLREIQPLVKSYPYVICTDPGACYYRRQFGTRNFIFIFVDDLREEAVQENIHLMSYCRTCKVLFILKETIPDDFIPSLFTKILKEKGLVSQFARIENNAVKIYTNLATKNCSLETRVTLVWTPGCPLNVTHTWSTRFNDLNGCSIPVTTLDFAPKMVLDEHEDGSLTIGGGLEGELITTFAEKFNFTITATYPSIEDRIKYSRKTAIINDVASGTSQIGIGRLRPVSNMYSSIVFSVAYDHECVTWAVPRVINWANNIVWMEFPCTVWASVGLVFATICIIAYVCHNIDSMKSGDRKRIEFVVIVLETFSIHLGNPMVNLPTTVTGRFILLMGLYYTMVITTAYKTSLASILTTDIGTLGIIDAEGIIAANLSFGGASYNLEFLQDQANGDETISKLIERFMVMNDNSEVMRRLKYDKNFACLSRSSALFYERHKLVAANEPINFEIIKNCVLNHQTVMVFPKNSFLRELADNLIARLIESGILPHWDSDGFPTDYLANNKGKPSAETYFESSTRDKFRNIFILYACCIALCFITFLIELGGSMYRRRIMKHVSD